MFTVGKVVELSEAERRDLAHLAEVMFRRSRRQEPGWLAEYVKAMTRANRIIHEAVTRSHAS